MLLVGHPLSQGLHVTPDIWTSTVKSNILILSEHMANIHWYFKNTWRIYIDTSRTCGEYTLIHSERVANIHWYIQNVWRIYILVFTSDQSYTFWRIIRSGDVYTKRSGWQPGRYQWKKTSQRKKSSIVAQRLCAALSDFFSIINTWRLLRKGGCW